MESIRGVPPGAIREPENPAERLRDIAVLANELADIFQCHESDDVGSAMEEVLTRYTPSVSLDPGYCVKLIAARLEKLKQYAPIFEINVASSDYCNAVQSWLNRHADMTDGGVKQTA